MDTLAGNSIERGTPTPTRKAQVANLRERRQSGLHSADADSPADAASINSNGTILIVSNVRDLEVQEEATAEAAAVAAATTAETRAVAETDRIPDPTTLKEHVSLMKYQVGPSTESLGGVIDSSEKFAKGSGGLQLAVQSTVRFPDQDDSASTSKDGKSALSDRYNTLLNKLRDAAENYEALATARDLQDDYVDPARASKLNRELHEANNRLLHAERNYYVYKAEVNELRSLPRRRRAKAEVSNPLTAPNQAALEEKAKDAMSYEAYEMYAEELRTLKRLAERDSENIANLRDQLQRNQLDAVRSSLVYRRENTELSGYNSHLSWEAAQLATKLVELHDLNETLEWRIEYLENSCTCSRGVPEPSSDAAGASAARVLILTVIGELGTREDDNVAMMEPLKDACGEVNRLQEFLEKYGVLRCRKVSDGAQGGESDGRAFL